ncbi:DCC1-like thiol-disulfide oxidoreductase family protein [Streptomyces sp. NPDC058867]|uniref:DCC1-like thiol-disulfide oxidoreductase family protein n=1 Tax=unclassified Streptomyces TaxID=2593676 RepID=UPI003682EF9E
MAAGVTADAAADRDPARVPVRGLTVLYDAQCSLCAFVRDWLVRQPQLVPLELVPAGSEEAVRRFPELGRTREEITVVGDGGQVYRSAAAWIVVLWALREHRALSHRLSRGTGAWLARGAVLAAARWRGRQWGGQAYSSTDGWTYRPAQGWVHGRP